MRSRLFGFGPVLLVAFLLNSAACAQSVIAYLDHPVPEQLRQHANAMVRALRPGDADEAIANLLTLERAASHPETVLLRIKANCREEQCMTVIARGDADGMVPELILSAGGAIVVADYAYGLWGAPTWSPIHFEGAGGSTLSIHRRGAFWVVEGCAQCLEWPAPRNPLPPKEGAPPVPPPTPMSFEEFKALLGR